MKCWSIPVLLSSAIINGGCGDSPEAVPPDPAHQEEEAESSGSPTLETERPPDVVRAAPTAPERPTNLAGGLVGDTEILIDGFAHATLTEFGTLTLWMSEREMSCDEAALAPGDVYLRLTVDPNDDVFEAKTFITSKAKIDAEVTRAPDLCQGVPTTLAQNEGLLPRSVTFTELSDTTVSGHFEVEMYDGPDAVGLVTGEFNATRCGSNLLPVCQL